jgi:hypothetical protein
MATYFDFRSETVVALHGFTDDPTGARLPAEDGPWTLVRQVEAGDRWIYPVTRAMVSAGILENGFFLWEPRRPPTSTKPVIESSRVEGTAVYDPADKRIGTVQQLLIEKVSGRVLYVDIIFGGFLGLGAHHHTIPWEKLAYDTRLGGYRTDITEEQVRAAPVFLGDDEIWPDPKREKEAREYWSRRSLG